MPGVIERSALLAGVAIAACAKHETSAPERPRVEPSARDASIDVPKGAPPSAPPPATPRLSASALADTVGPCDDGHKNAPCLYLLQGHCVVERGEGPANHEIVTCPADPARAPRPRGDACIRADACRGVSDEGCCIGCNDPFQTRITASCAKRIEMAGTCAEVKRALETKGCAK